MIAMNQETTIIIIIDLSIFTCVFDLINFEIFTARVYVVIIGL